MYKIINLTPEKNATRSVGEYVSRVLGDSTSTSYMSYYAESYIALSGSDWSNFDSVVNESIVFMFVRNPYDRLVSSFIHTCLSLDYTETNPKWYFDFPITKENQLKCFKNFCMTFVKKEMNNAHINLQTDVINLHVNSVINNFTRSFGEEFGRKIRVSDFNNPYFSIIPYIENEKIFIGKVENIKNDLSKLVLHFGDNLLVRTKTVPEWIGDNSEIKFSKDYRDWYDDELYDLMTPIFKKELEVLNYGF